MSKEERLSMYLDDCELRRKTFVDHWPTDKRNFSIDEFVRQGFYCLGEEDKVQCIYCRGCLKAWEENDDILLEHRKHFPNCPFILQPYHFPEFRDYSSRLQTFNDWPKQFKQTPRDLARAGMFYMGKGDQTQCFWCHGILSDWEPSDVPILEHKKYFGHCKWLQVIKDTPFFKEACRRVNSRATDQTNPKTVISAEDRAREMGFSNHVIDKAKKSCGSSFSVETLVKALVELDDIKTSELKPAKDSKSIDMKVLANPNSAVFDRTCKICMDANFDVIFLPCGHLMCCEKCAKSIQICPMCRASIETAFKVYM